MALVDIDRLWGSSPGTVWAKAPVATDVVEDGGGCVEVAQGLWGLVGGGGEMGCSSQGKGLESGALQMRTQMLTSPGAVCAKSLVIPDP